VNGDAPAIHPSKIATAIVDWQTACEERDRDSAVATEANLVDRM